MITRPELMGKRSRRDAQVAYYFSAVPFNWADSDWSAVYAALAACSSPLVVSAAVLPMQIPASFGQKLLTLAPFYGRPSGELEQAGGLYFGPHKLPPSPLPSAPQPAFPPL